MTALALNIWELHPNYVRENNKSRLKRAFWRAIRLLNDEQMKKFLSKHIEVSQQVRSGKPVISGTRITVEDIITLWLADCKEKDIIEQFSKRITQEQIDAALVYYFFRKGKYQMFKHLYLGCIV